MTREDVERMMDYIAHNGALHEYPECPEDDTCDCKFRETNASVTVCCKFLHDAPSRISALEAQVKALTEERDAAKHSLAFIGGAVQKTRAHVWTETPGVEVQVFPDADVPHSLRLVVRDVYAKEDLANVRVEAFRLDLLCGPIVRLLLEHRLAMAAAEKLGWTFHPEDAKNRKESE